MRWLGVALASFAVLGTGSVWGEDSLLRMGKPPSATMAQAAAAPQPAAAAAPSVDNAKPVNLPLVVRDAKGELTAGLGKGDVSLLVDGKPQGLRTFEAGGNLLWTIGLLVDTGAAQRNMLEEERAASRTFLDQMLTGAKDQGFVMQFAREVELLQDVTAAKERLQAAVRELGTASPPPTVRDASVDADDPAERRGRAEQRGTAFYDAVFLASDEVMRRQTGRKALIVLTDGNDRSSKETLAQALEAALRRDTVLYAVYVKGEAARVDRSLDDRDRYPGNGGGYPGNGYPGGGYPGGYPGGGYPGGGYPGGGYPRGTDTDRLPNARNDGKKILERMARETGGRLFEASKKQSLAEIYAEIAKELRAQYRLEFVPQLDAAAEGYHKVQVVLAADKKRLVTQTRDGYYIAK